MILVDAKKLKKTYRLPHGNITVLQEIDLQIQSGEMVAIMGSSGSGKSTLMHILGCLERPSEGHYFLKGKNISLLSDSDLSFLRASLIGFVFQSFNLILHLTILENVQLPFLYNQIGLRSSQKDCVHALERVGLSHRLQHLPTELSGGEMQRVAIARALVINPLLILADEPTGSLDGKTGASILSLFQSLHEQGSTIILVTHDPLVAKQCQRVLHLQDGVMTHLSNALGH